RFGAARDAAELRDRRIELPHFFGEPNLELGGRAERKPLLGDALHGFDDVGMRVTQDRGAPRADVVDGRAPVGAETRGATRSRDDDRSPAPRAKRAHRTVDAPYDHLFGSLEERPRYRVSHRRQDGPVRRTCPFTWPTKQLERSTRIRGSA